MFRADVAVDGHNEIAQDSSCMLAHSHVICCSVVDYRINTTATAVSLSRVLQKTTKKLLRITWYHMLVSCCTNAKKKNTTRTRTCSYSYVLVQRHDAEMLIRCSTGKIKSNHLGPNVHTSATMSRCLERTKTAVALPL